MFCGDYNPGVWRTVGFLIYFWPVLFGVTLLLPFAWLLRILGGRREARRLVEEVVSRWSRQTLRMLGARITIVRRDSLPKHGHVCVVSNHQSYGDSLLLQGHLGIVAGFVAKRELAMVPPLSLWMRAVGTVFLRRGDARHARAVMTWATRTIVSGHPMAVFPEGTRSRGGPPGRFKAGALRLAWESQATIVPVTVHGTANLLERQGYLKSADVLMVVHRRVEPAEYRDWSKQELATRLRDIIVTDLPEPAE